MPKRAESKKPKGKQLEEFLKDEREARLRLAAEYDNFRKRMLEREKMIAHRLSAELLEKLLPVFDNFYRLASHAPTVPLEDAKKLTGEDLKRLANYFAGLAMIEKQMEEVLSRIGISRVQTKGVKFDPNLHEAISFESNSEVPADYIISEVESGWMIEGKLIKPAKVRVSRG